VESDRQHEHQVIARVAKKGGKSEGRQSGSGRAPN